MMADLKTPAVFAHRGASAYAPENTLAAFRLALEQHTDGIELDVHLTADDHIVVIHDLTLDRTTNATGRICDLTLAEIRKADAGNGEQVPTLEEVLNLVGDQAWINIELKGRSPKLPGKVLAMVEAHHLQEKIIYSSFNPRLLIKLRQIQPKAKVGILLLPTFAGKLVGWLFEPFVQPWSLHPHYSLVRTKFVQRARRKGQAILAYTVDDPAEMLRLITLGIQGIITNDPTLTLQTIKAAQ